VFLAATVAGVRVLTDPVMVAQLDPPVPLAIASRADRNQQAGVGNPIDS
jgi:hypothetical protein